jgi:hypothetical protein
LQRLDVIGIVLILIYALYLKKSTDTKGIWEEDSRDGVWEGGEGGGVVRGDEMGVSSIRAADARHLLWNGQEKGRG